MARKPVTLAKRVYPTRLASAVNDDLTMSRRRPIDREFSVEVSRPTDRYAEVLGPFALHEAFRAADTYDRTYFVNIYVIDRDYPDMGSR